MQDCHFCKLLISEMMPNHLTSENNEQQSQDSLDDFVFWNTIAQFEFVNNIYHSDPWSTLNPLLTPLGSLFISSPFEGGGGGLNRDRGLIWEGGLLFNLEKTNGISSPWRTRIQSGEAQEQEGWRSCSRGSESNLNVQLVNKPPQISPHKVLQSWLINAVYHYFISEEYFRRGEGGLIESGDVWRQNPPENWAILIPSGQKPCTRII